MKVIYDSLSGKAKAFASNLGYEIVDIKEVKDQIVVGPLFLVTRNSGYGEIPQTTLAFMRKNYRSVIGIAVSSNRNWGRYYGAAGDSLERIYKIPCVLKFDGAGQDEDVQVVKEFLDKHK